MVLQETQRESTCLGRGAGARGSAIGGWGGGEMQVDDIGVWGEAEVQEGRTGK